MLNAVSAEWLKLKREEIYSISIQPCGHKTKCHQTKSTTTTLICFCGMELSKAPHNFFSMNIFKNKKR